MLYHFIPISGNKKTGPIPVVTASRKTCPPSCPFMGKGCYAESGPIRIHWEKVTRGQRGNEFPQLLDKIRTIPKHTIWRYGVAGDLPGVGDEIDSDKLQQLAEASKGRHAIIYTHKPMTPENTEALKNAQSLGLNPIVSSQTPIEGFPTARVVPPNLKGESVTKYRKRVPETKGVTLCPAAFTSVTCARCRLCAFIKPGKVVGFPAHGSAKSRIEI